MKKVRFFLLLMIAFLALSACTPASESEIITEPTTVATVSEIKPLHVYQNAVNELERCLDIHIDVEQERRVFVDQQVFSEKAVYTVDYQQLNQSDFTGKLKGNIDFGDEFSSTIEEVYYQGFTYSKVNNYSYKTEMAVEEFIKRLTPVVLLDASAYASVALDDNVLSFSDAIRLEDWIAQDGFDLIEASGTALLDDEMLLCGFTYSVAFDYGSVRYEIDYTTNLSRTVEDVDKPSAYAHWREIPLADAPLMLERAYAYLMMSEEKDVQSTQIVQSDAVGFSAVEYNDLLYHRDSDLKLLDRTYLEVLNMLDGDIASFSHSRTYEDGMFTSFMEGEETERLETDSSEVENAYAWSIGYSYPHLNNIEELYVSYVQGGVVLDYTFSESFSEGYRQSAQSFLFGEPQYLDLQSSGYELLMAEGYLAIDQYSGLPTSNSVSYSATHTIEGEKYPLSLQLNRIIHAVDRSAYTAITGEAVVREENSEQPTPLFYRVTGENGQQMWMLGTIHLGDARTGNLPQQIYDAFDSADALAVEFDLNDFAEQLAEDHTLAESVLQEYLYMDGTTIEEHLQTPDLYAAAVQTMKMTGQLQGTILYTKPVIWSQIIEEFYLRQGYALSPEDGVDVHLLNLAEEQDKTILNVESGLDQLKMLSGFSDEIQELMLLSTLSIDPISYNAQQMELYDLWCEGDIEKLSAIIRTDTSDMTQEELELYEEYVQAMETDRNEQMLQVAVDYLESGETIFYAVGLAHLLSEDGLVYTLQNAGYTVEQIIFS